MNPEPEFIKPFYKGSDKLKGKVALITGGDSGIGRACAVYFAREGADISIVYLEEHEDAKETKRLVENEGRKCLLIACNIKDELSCKEAVDLTVNKLGRVDCLVNNAAEQHMCEKFEEIKIDQVFATFETNILSMFYFVKAALPHLREGSTIINTTSITAYKGNPVLIDYSSTKGAIVAFTRSLSQQLIERGIRVNGVAPGPIWTPLIPATFPKEKVKEFGTDTPMKRAGQPSEVAPCFVFLASDDSSYLAGQILHPNGGVVVNG